MHRKHRPQDDGIIDEVAIARTFAGDAKVGARLTNAERDEVLRRAGARCDEEQAIRERQRVSPSVRYGAVTLVGPEAIGDHTWKSLLSEGLGLREAVGDDKRFNCLFQSIYRQRKRDAKAAAAA